MDQWWERHRDVDMGGYDRDHVEDVTGCIPLLLDKCLVDKKIDLDVDDLRSVRRKAVSFVTQIRENTRGKPSKWKRYVRLARLPEHH